jgi:hypothetical protein
MPSNSGRCRHLKVVCDPDKVDGVPEEVDTDPDKVVCDPEELDINILKIKVLSGIKHVKRAFK